VASDSSVPALGSRAVLRPGQLTALARDRAPRRLCEALDAIRMSLRMQLPSTLYVQTVTSIAHAMSGELLCSYQPNDRKIVKLRMR
jgi:hypothetical protein